MKKFILLLFILSVFSFNFLTYAEVVPDEEPVLPLTATFVIRSGETTLYNGNVTIPEEGFVDIADNTGTDHSVSSRSVLALLVSLDNTNTDFDITNLSYYSSFSSFYLKCLTPSSGSELCDNWQYAIGNTTPSTSIDTTLLSGGETVGLYFGSPHRVSLSTTSVTKGTSFIATAESYNYMDNTWSALTGVTIGVTVPNPNDPWIPIVVASQTVDTEGKATITISDVGEYSIGIAEDFYFPSYTITVTNPEQGGGGGGGNPIPVFNVKNALSYLYSVQNPDGSFGSDLYTDWTAIAYAASEASQDAKDALLGYLSSHTQINSLLTDNERRAIALLSLGENPYSFSGADYIYPIVSSFDGKQFGDTSLVNDDIFALLPLSASGYSLNDDIIAKDILFLSSNQRTDGSWEGSIDLTAAAIQALKAFNALPEIVAKANIYLQNSQQADGGFGSVYSTSWVLQAGSSWMKNGRTPMDYLGAMQASDGAAISVGENLNNRVWATSYAIPAVLNKPWSVLMHPVSKPPVSQVVVSSAKNIQDVKKVDKILEKVEEIKPEKIPKEINPEVIEKTQKVLLKNNTEDKEELGNSIPLLATAQKSKADIPMLVTIGSIISIVVLAFVIRKLFRSR